MARMCTVSAGHAAFMALTWFREAMASREAALRSMDRAWAKKQWTMAHRAIYAVRNYLSEMRAHEEFECPRGDHHMAEHERAGRYPLCGANEPWSKP